MAKEKVVLYTELSGLEFFKRGKVRDIYDLGEELLIVATDRISAFDVVLPTGIPEKGKVLTKLSAFWFDFIHSIIPNHLVTADVQSFPRQLNKHRLVLKDRSMLVKKTKPIEAECVVRGWLAGSGWREYKKSGAICGVKLPPGLKESEKLPQPIFTPATKASSGHDVNITEQQMSDLVGSEVARELKSKSLAIYQRASCYAETKGIIISDTKFEFGMCNGTLILIDELLTPDSSRFWPKEGYEPGKSQPSFDKQFVRDYLESLDWDKSPPGPELPQEIVRKTHQKYLEAYTRITGREWSNEAQTYGTKCP